MNEKQIVLCQGAITNHQEQLKGSAGWFSTSSSQGTTKVVIKCWSSLLILVCKWQTVILVVLTCLLNLKYFILWWEVVLQTKLKASVSPTVIDEDCMGKWIRMAMGGSNNLVSTTHLYIIIVMTHCPQSPKREEKVIWSQLKLIALFEILLLV